MDEVEGLIRSLGRSGALRIIRDLGARDEISFNELGRRAGYPIIAYRVLKDFQKYGLVRKRETKDRLGTVKFSLTEKGMKVKAMLDQLNKL